jgi:transglutaminase-like putative cysteine protease
MMHNNPYLQETYYCDYSNLMIQKTAQQFIDLNEDVAVEIFNFVRDGYPICADEISEKASKTMQKGYGACWNKALVLIALLRYCSIQCRMVKHPLKKEFLKPLLGNNIFFLNNPYYHFFVQIYMNKKWISVDPSLDSKTYNVLYQPLNVPWNIDWDGKNDHIIHKDKIAGPIEIIYDIDGEFNNCIGNKSTQRLFISFLNSILWKKTGWHNLIQEK